jgi:hypothetical protein
VSARGGKPTSLQVCAHAVVPSVSIEQQEFAFGGIYIGSSAQQTLTLKNSSGIPAALLLDLSGHPEFRLELAERARAPAAPEEEFEEGPLQLISAGGVKTHRESTGEFEIEGENVFEDNRRACKWFLRRSNLKQKKGFVKGVLGEHKTAEGLGPLMDVRFQFQSLQWVRFAV